MAHQARLSVGILQARILEWVAMSFSKESSQPRDQTHVSCIDRQILYPWATREAPNKWILFNNIHIYVDIVTAYIWIAYTQLPEL